MNYINKVASNNQKLLELPLKHILTKGQNQTSTVFKNWLTYLFFPFPRKSLKIWGCNTRSFQNRAKQEQMYQSLLKEKPDIVMLNETWLKKDSHNNNFYTDNPDYYMLTSEFDQNYQGSAILVKKNIRAINAYQTIHPTKNLSEITVTVDPENTISFLSIYVPPDGDSARDEARSDALKQLETFFEKNEGKRNFIGYSDINTKLRECDTPFKKMEAQGIKDFFKKNNVELIYSKNENDFTRPSSSSKEQSSEDNGNYIDFLFQRGLVHKKHKIKANPVDSDHLLLEILIKTKTPYRNMFYSMILFGLFYKYCQEHDFQQIFHHNPHFNDNNVQTPFIQQPEQLQNQKNDTNQNIQSDSQFRKQQNSEKKIQLDKNAQKTQINIKKQQSQNINNNQQKQQQQIQKNVQQKAIDYYYFIGFMYLGIKMMFNQQYIAAISKQIINYIFGI